MGPLITREIVCSGRDYDTVKKRYPKREVITDRHAPDGKFYYQGRGHIRVFHLKTNSIYAYSKIVDEDGFLIDPFAIKQIWPRQN